MKCFPDKFRLKEFIITKYLLYEMLKGLIKKKKIKNINSKLTTNSQLSTTVPKQKQKQELSKQLEQEQNHRNGDHMESYQQGGGGWRMEGKVQGIRSINGRCKVDRGRLGIV